MTFKPKRLCKHPRCVMVVDNYSDYLCNAHKKEKWKVEKRFNTDPFYHSTMWRKFSKQYRKSNPFCFSCAKEGRTSLTEVVDHITPRAAGGSDYDLKNLQPLCHQCHNRKRQTERKK